MPGISFFPFFAVAEQAHKNLNCILSSFMMPRYKNKIILRRYESPCGLMLLGSFGNKICMADWAERRNRNLLLLRLQRYLKADFEESSSEAIEKAMAELDEYFDGRRTDFDIPVIFAGTLFQKTVWEALREIAYGTTESYSQIARRIGIPKGVRAVANAVGANPISIFVPCHRVIGSDGSLTGYAGGLDAKRKLLTLEK